MRGISTSLPLQGATDDERVPKTTTRSRLLRHGEAEVCSAGARTPGLRRGCCTKPSARTWATLAATVAEGPGSAEARQGAPRASDDLPLFRSVLRKVPVSP